MTQLVLLTNDSSILQSFKLIASEAGLSITPVSSPREAAAAADGEGVLIYDEALASEAELLGLAAGKNLLLVPILGFPDSIKSFSKSRSQFFINKPIDPEDTLRALHQLADYAARRSHIGTAPVYKNHEQDAANYLVSRFWRDVALGIVDSVQDIIFKADGIGLNQNELTVFPILLEIKGWKKQHSLKERHLSLQMIIKKAETYFTSEACACRIVQLTDTCLFILCGGTVPGLSEMSGKCQLLADFAEKKLDMALVCCLGDTVYAPDFSDMSRRMLEYSGQNIFCEKVTYLRFDSRGERSSETAPDLSQWKLLLEDMRIERALSSITDFFDATVFSGGTGADWLGQFMADFNQMINVLLSEKGIAAHKIFKLDNELYTAAGRSASGMLAYVCHIIEEYSRYCKDADREQSAVSSAVSYIKSHLSSPMTRAEIAEHVHLSQNYLARIFKKEIGMNISDFIIRERINYAVELLTYTSVPLGELASRAGYDNYSYFYTIFRKLMGMKPSEYREKYAARKGKDEDK